MDLVLPADRVVAKSYFKSYKEYEALYQQSIKDPETFWRRTASELLHWEQKFETVLYGSFLDKVTASAVWFPEGRLNACYNALDRHAMATPDKVAYVWEQDEPGNSVSYTYAQVLYHTCQLANYLKGKLKVKSGDVVTIYMPMIPAVVFSMLACCRIGAVHNVVFAGFSVEALLERIEDSKSRVLITADHGKRGGKLIGLKKIAHEAVSRASCVEKVIVFKHSGQPIIGAFDEEKDVWWDEMVAKESPYCPCEPMSAEAPLFILYTSGSTGKPKGVVHSIAGYLLGAQLSFKYAFDYQPGDVYACVADIGWITGHTYILYGPLLQGATSVLFESTPLYPTPERYWDMVDKLKVTQLYTSPTAVRTLRKCGDEHVLKYNLSSLRIIGTVGEPINSEAWRWLHEVVGKKRVSIVDTYWQTETGSFLLLPLPGSAAAKPGAACFPFFGIDAAVLDPQTGRELKGNNVTGVLAIRAPWPSCARTVYNNHERYLSAYFQPFPGYYFTGDGVTRDSDGYYWINGRVDDVINISGHRLSTAEVENVLSQSPKVAESAVVGIADEVTGQAICCFVVLKPYELDNLDIVAELKNHVRGSIGAFASPKFVHICPDLPKTRSGKLVRRILRKIGGGELTGKESPQEVANILGDLTTLAEPQVIDSLVKIINTKPHI